MFQVYHARPDSVYEKPALPVSKEQAGKFACFFQKFD